MEKLQNFKKSWEDVKASLKQKYATLTDQDLKYVEGKEHELYINLQKKLGLERAEVDKVLKEHHDAIQKRIK